MLTKELIAEGVKSLVFRTGIFVDNAFRPAASGKTFATENPATGAVLAQVAAGDAPDVDLAVRSARRAFDSRVWAGMAPADRKGVLQRWAAKIDEHRLELTLLESLEAGKPVTETFNGDIPETSKCIRWFAEAIDKLNDAVTPTDPSILSIVRREPIGVVGAILPWNYSALMAAWKLGPALAAGNSVVVKPAQQTSLATLRLAELAAEAGLPQGVLSVVPGLGQTAGQAVGRHPDIDLVTFTGSTAVGRLLLQYAGESNLKRVTLELGGKSPQIVFPSVLEEPGMLQKVAEHCVNAAFWNMSENCSCGSRLIVHRSVKEKLLPLMVQLLDERWKVGSPLDPATVVGALIEKNHLHKVLRFIEEGKKGGAKLLRGGRQVLQESGGYFVEPTIFDDCNNQMTIAREESESECVLSFLLLTFTAKSSGRFWP
jgi:gamma-glutamyl-gamma-aminobutyraldehyde dehydrogenase